MPFLLILALFFLSPAVVYAESGIDSKAASKDAKTQSDDLVDDASKKKSVADSAGDKPQQPISEGEGTPSSTQSPSENAEKKPLSSTSAIKSEETRSKEQAKPSDSPPVAEAKPPKKSGFGAEKLMGLAIGLVFLTFVLMRLSRLKDEGKDHRLWIGLGVCLTLAGHGIGLFVAPKEFMMGDVGRILYVHVPTAWAALLAYLFAFALAIGSLWTGKRPWDASLAATIEVGVLYNILLTIQGSIWAKPTWNTWWTWDPRLTTTAIMVISFAGLVILRSLIQNPERRQLVTAVGAIIAFVNVPIVYMSVKWWSSLHQEQSSMETVSNTMHLPLRLAAFGMVFLLVGFIIARAKIAIRHLDAECDGAQLPDKTKRTLSEF